MKRANYTLFSTIALFTVLMLSCSGDDECNFSTIAGVNYSLKKVDTLVNTFYITPYDNLNDTLFASGTNKYVLTLPLSASEDTTSFAFISNNTVVDMMVFYHTMRLKFLDEKCGFVPEFHLDSLKYTSQNIDTIIWMTREVTTDIENDNIQIHY